LAQDMFDLT